MSKGPNPDTLKRFEIIAEVHTEPWFDSHIGLIVLNHYEGHLETLYAAALLGERPFLRTLFPNLTIRHIKAMRDAWADAYPFFAPDTLH